MPREPRIEYVGAIYHVMNRGNQKRNVFLSDRDREVFLKTLEETVEKTGWLVHGYVFMSNHYHLLIETPRGNLVKGMQWLNSTYTLRFNARNKKRGHLFQGRYKALMVDEGDGQYFLMASDYVHLNPMRAKMCVGETVEKQWEAFWKYRWSSAWYFGGESDEIPPWLCWRRVFGELGIKGEGRRQRLEYRLGLEVRWGEEGKEDQWKKLRRGWCLGDLEFKKELLGRLQGMKSGVKAENWSGEAVCENEELMAERLLKQGIGALTKGGHDWSRAGEWKKGDWRRAWLAWWILSRSRVGLKWVAKRLGRGYFTAASNAYREIAQHQAGDLRLKRLTKYAKNYKLED